MKRSRMYPPLVSLLLLVSLLVASCSGGATVEPTPSATDKPLLNPEVAGEVEFWHFWGSPNRRTGVRRIVAMCQEQLPNITIKEVYKPWGEIWSANIEAVKAGTGMPDVIVEDRPQLPQRAAANIDISLQPYVERDGFDSTQFWLFTWQETLYNEQSYGIPFETDVRVLFWNKNAFREAGLDPERPPQSWEELAEYADKLDKKNEAGEYERIGFFPLWKVGPDTWALTNGHQWVQEGHPRVDDPAVLETVEWIQGWIERYGGWETLQAYQAEHASAPFDLFMSGAAAMIVDVAGYNSIINFYRPVVPAADGTMENLEWGIAATPSRKTERTWSGGFALSIPQGADNPDAAWEFIKCATSAEAQISWARDTAAIPTNKEAARDPLLLADSHWQAIIDQMESSMGSTYVAAYPNWTEQINPKYEQVWRGEMTAEELLREAQQAIDQTISENQ